MDNSLKILAFVGSLRRQSLHRSLLTEAARLAPSDMRVEIFDIGDIPLFDEDVEAQGDPRSVAALKEAIAAADGVLISSPEYNGSMTGVIKNTIDWASRRPRPLVGKPVALMGGAPGRLSSVRGQLALAQVLNHLKAFVLPGDMLLFPELRDCFGEDGFLDPTPAERLVTFLERFDTWIRLVSPKS